MPSTEYIIITVIIDSLQAKSHAVKRENKK